MSRAEDIKLYKQFICSICRSKHCQHNITVKEKGRNKNDKMF